MNIIVNKATFTVRENPNAYIKNNINSFEQSYRIQLKDGTYKYFYDYTKIIKNDNNEIINFIGYIFDQTNLKEKEKSFLPWKIFLYAVCEFQNFS